MAIWEKITQNLNLEKSFKSGQNLILSCPFHEDSTPSLSISTNPEKPFYQCFSCGSKGSLISFYMQLEGKSFKEAIKELENNNISYNIEYKTLPKKEKEIIDYSNFIEKSHKLLNLLNRSLKQIGLDYETVTQCRIGSDDFGKWIFPVKDYRTKQYVGAEIRKNNFTNFENGNKCYKLKGTPSCLSIVYEPIANNSVAVISEGFKDAYFIVQHLNNVNAPRFTILTPSCGVQTIPQLLKENNYLKEFSEVIFVLDNDKAGNEVMKEILSMDQSHFKKHGFNFKQDEDFEMYYKRSLRF